MFSQKLEIMRGNCPKDCICSRYLFKMSVPRYRDSRNRLFLSRRVGNGLRTGELVRDIGQFVISSFRESTVLNIWKKNHSFGILRFEKLYQKISICRKMDFNMLQYVFLRKSSLSTFANVSSAYSFLYCTLQSDIPRDLIICSGKPVHAEVRFQCNSHEIS